MLESGIQQLVVANAAVAALIGTRFYPVLVPEDAIYPCASYQVISDVPDYRMADAGIEVKRLQVDTWSGGTSSATYSAARAVQAAIRAVLELYRGTLPSGTVVAGIFVANSQDEFEQDARSFRTTTDYMVHFYPST
jgi:hypothetical protein